MTTERDDDPGHASSPTDHVLSELQLYGWRKGEDEPDPRPLPDGRLVAGAVADIFDALLATLRDTRLEPDIEDLLWAQVNLFHRAAQRIERDLDANESAQKKSQLEQDGSELRSVELERPIAEGLSLIERRDAMELFRDTAAQLYERDTGAHWRPRSGSLVNHRTLTAAMIDSRDFVAAKRRSQIEPLVPSGPKIAFTGGIDCNDHRAIWAALDKALAKHPGMALLHGGTPKGAEAIAAAWAAAARSRRSCSSPNGAGMPRPHRSSATMRCWPPCRSASSPSQARASRRTLPTRPSVSASRSGASALEAAPSSAQPSRRPAAMRASRVSSIRCAFARQHEDDPTSAHDA